MRMFKTASKGLAGIALVGLLAFNIQVGSGQESFDIKNQISEAKAGCPDASDWCAAVEYPDGTTWIEVGRPIVITPPEE